MCVNYYVCDLMKAEHKTPKRMTHARGVDKEVFVCPQQGVGSHGEANGYTGLTLVLDSSWSLHRRRHHHEYDLFREDGRGTTDHIFVANSPVSWVAQPRAVRGHGGSLGVVKFE